MITQQIHIITFDNKRDAKLFRTYRHIHKDIDASIIVDECLSESAVIDLLHSKLDHFNKGMAWSSFNDNTTLDFSFQFPDSNTVVKVNADSSHGKNHFLCISHSSPTEIILLNIHRSKRFRMKLIALLWTGLTGNISVLDQSSRDLLRMLGFGSGFINPNDYKGFLNVYSC